MNIKAVVLAVLSLGSIGVACAEEAKSDWTFTGNAGLFSDYRFRGFTQTNYRPAFQGGFDLAHSSGLYVGNWNSNVEQNLYRGASMEMDFYGGYKYAVGDVNLDVGGIYYAYPSGSNGSTKQAHQTELYFGAAYGEFSAKFSYGLSNFFGLGDDTPVKTNGNYYVDLGYAHDLGNGLGINAHYGYQYVKNGTDAGLISNSVSDYRVGVTQDMKGWLVGASVVATSKKNFAPTGNGKDGGKTSVVLSVVKSF
ncbi:TorF family putative porin [Aquabacterium sp.]|uniref:TorF family putative porin n=1 Tax=Aquabacterium sp. TaxID=1872578 RepID=UPI003B6B0DC5